MRTPHLLMLLTVASVPLAAEHAPVGFRGDGSGVFPDDCTPVTAWDMEKGTNVVWIRDFGPTANWGNNSSPIVAGGKVFCITEPTPESLGPVLHCLDPADGTVLWEVDCHHVDLLPAGIQQEVTAALKAERRFMPAFDDLRSRYKGTQKKLPDPAAAKELNAIKAETEQLGLVGVCGTKKDGSLDGSERSVHLAWDQGKYDGPEIDARRKLLAEHGYNWFVDPWIMCGSGAIGYAPCTPCSDGERVYVATAFYDLLCLDMDGKVLWKVFIPPGEITEGVNFRASFFPSPVLYDDLVIRYWANDHVPAKGMSVRAYDKLSGKEVWRAGKGTVEPYALGTPLRLEIDGVKLLYLADGRVLRLDDGKEVCRVPVHNAHGRPDTVHGDVVFTSNGQDGGRYRGPKSLPDGHIIAYRLAWKEATARETLTATELWRGPYGRYPIYRQGKLYTQGGKEKTNRRVDATTGKTEDAFYRRYEQSIKDNYFVNTIHYFTIAGNHLFGYAKGIHQVYTLPDRKFVSQDRSQKEGRYYQYGGQMFHSGNRSFFLEGMHGPRLVCIGDPQEKVRLSQVHR